MAYKNHEDQLRAQRLWYQRNKEKLKIEHKKWRKENKTALLKWFEELKGTLKCQDCDENFPPCLQFHHRNPLEKRFTISAAVRSAVCKEEILKEIEKCDVLCGNCHMKRHFKK